MKRKLCLVLLLCLGLSLLVPLHAFAEAKSAAERGRELIATAVNPDSIRFPQEDSYLDEPKVLYARKPWYQPSLPVECLPKLKTNAPRLTELFEGTRVTVVAEENDMSCIVYPGPNNKLWVGWIQSIRLLDAFPGERYTIGEAAADETPTLDAVGSHWSNEYLLNTRRIYTVLDEPVKACTGFTMQYQVTARNTGLTRNVLGPRTLYVCDGETWTELGTFPYDDLGAVEVDVRLDEPMDLVAFGTAADCVQPYDFEFRQIAYAFLTQ